MKRSWTRLIVLSLFSLAAAAPAVASSRIASADRAPTDASCSVKGRFDGPVLKDETVYWRFDLHSTQSAASSKDCPDVNEPLLIPVPGGQYARIVNEFVYPNSIEPPSIGRIYEFQLKKARTKLSAKSAAWTESWSAPRIDRMTETR